MPRKGQLEEIFSRALYHDDSPALYVVSYRDFDTIVQVSLPDFVKLSANFEVIPMSRVLLVTKGGQVLFRKHGFRAR